MGFSWAMLVSGRSKTFLMFFSLFDAPAGGEILYPIQKASWEDELVSFPIGGIWTRSLEGNTLW